MSGLFLEWLPWARGMGALRNVGSRSDLRVLPVVQEMHRAVCPRADTHPLWAPGSAKFLKALDFSRSSKSDPDVTMLKTQSL